MVAVQAGVQILDGTVRDEEGGGEHVAVEVGKDKQTAGRGS